MKRSGTTTMFVAGCIAVLIGAYLAGICIRGFRFKHAGVESEPAAAVADNTAAKPASSGSEAELAPAAEQESPAEAPAVAETEGSPDDMSGRMRDRFEGMTDEQRQEAIAKMRERFAGRRRDGGSQFPQLSEEDREKMRAEMEDLRSRWDGMSEEERQQATAQMREKYGFAPRIGGPSGGRRPGGRSGGSGQENN